MNLERQRRIAVTLLDTVVILFVFVFLVGLVQ